MNILIQHKLKLISKITFLILFVTGIQPLFGKQVTTTIDPEAILIGEHAIITFSLEVPETADVEFPMFNDTISANIEILNYGATEIHPSQSPGNVRVERRLTVTSWQEGFHPIVPFNFTITENNDTLTVESQPVLLEVQGVVLDEAAQLKDIKGILRIPVALSEVLPWILLAAILAVILFLLYRYFRNRKNRPVEESIVEKPQIPAHIAALNSLENLKARKLWQQGFVKEYYVELTDIIRHYLESRYGIGAIEMTTDEIISATNGRIANYESYNNLKYILQLADLVKFAKHIPGSVENEMCIDMSFGLVRSTISDDSSNEEKN